MSADQDLLDYLKNDAAHAKIQTELARRNADNWKLIALALVAALMLSTVTFGVSTYLIAQEHSHRLQKIFDSDWEMTTEKEKVSAQSETGNASANFNKADNNSSITQTTK